MRKKKICVCGHFGVGKNLLNGQTVKTKILTDCFKEKFGAEQVITVDTHGGKLKQIRNLFKLVRGLRTCENVAILPAHNGIKVLVPILLFFNGFYRRKLHYIVIGGWLSEFLDNKKRLAKRLKKFTAIYVETNTLKVKLENKGFTNVKVVPNAKNLSILKEEELTYGETEPFKVCTFSRVMKEKGIEDAANAVREINEEKGRVAVALDIYGQVEAGQEEWFNGLSESFPPYIRYNGKVPFAESVNVLKDYFLLLFPTRFFSEGVPGTVIDAYAAGVPVLSARWESFSDVIDEGVTGIGYEIENYEDFKNELLKAVDNPENVNGLKKNCLFKANEFDVHTVINEFNI